jgi:hypothetical protein
VIQTDTEDPEDIFTLGSLRDWMQAHAHLPDDTEIVTEGDGFDESQPLITVAQREWRPNEQGCMVVYDAAGNRRQVNQTLVVIRREDDFVQPFVDEDEETVIQFPKSKQASITITPTEDNP